MHPDGGAAPQGCSLPHGAFSLCPARGHGGPVSSAGWAGLTWCLPSAGSGARSPWNWRWSKPLWCRRSGQ